MALIVNHQFSAMDPSVFSSIQSKKVVVRRYTDGQLVSQVSPKPHDTIPIWVVIPSASTMLKGPPISPVQGPPLPPSAHTWATLISLVGKRTVHAKLVITFTRANCREVLRSERTHRICIGIEMANRSIHTAYQSSSSECDPNRRQSRLVQQRSNPPDACWVGALSG